MFQYVLKRILYFIPTFFIISLLAFSLGQVAPGDPVELKLQGGMGAANSGQASEKIATEQTYMEISKKMGLNLPSFYFTLTTAAYPDTLYKIPRKGDKETLGRLIHEYGNWEYISDYYHTAKNLEFELFDIKKDSTNFNQIQIIRNNVNELFREYEDLQVMRLLNEMDSAARITHEVRIDSVTWNRNYNSVSPMIPVIEDLQAKYTALKDNATPGKKYVPAINWHGSDNQYHRWLFGDTPWFKKKDKQLDQNLAAGESVNFEYDSAGYYEVIIKGPKAGEKDLMSYAALTINGKNRPISIDKEKSNKVKFNNIVRLEEGDDLDLTMAGGLPGNYDVQINYLPNHNPNKTAKGFFRFDFGKSYLDDRPVSSILLDALKWTLLLNLIAVVLIYLISIPIGVSTAIRKDSLYDRITTLVLFVLYSLPGFWIATLLVVFFTTDYYAEWMDIFPTYGLGLIGDEHSFWAKFIDRGYHLILPIFCVTYGAFAFISRQMRGAMSDTLKADYIRTAFSKGLKPSKVYWQHAFRNSLIPIITLFAGLLPSMISGSVIIETIFSIPGMGMVSIEAVYARNYPVLFTILLFAAILTMVGTLLTDILYAVVDPRISFSKKG